MALRTHLEVQQREDTRRDLAERMKFVPPDLRLGENLLLARRPEQNSARTKIRKVVQGEDCCCQRSHGGYQYRCVHFSGIRE